MLAGALGMDELLWASAVRRSTAVRSTPTRCRFGHRCGRRPRRTRPAINAVGRRSGNVVAVYVGGEARRLGAVRVVDRHRPGDRHDQAGDRRGRGRRRHRCVERYTTFRQVKRGRGASVIADGMAVVKGGTLRLTVPSTAFGLRLLPTSGCGCCRARRRELPPDPEPGGAAPRQAAPAAMRWAVQRGVVAGHGARADRHQGRPHGRRRQAARDASAAPRRRCRSSGSATCSADVQPTLDGPRRSGATARRGSSADAAAAASVGAARSLSDRTGVSEEPSRAVDGHRCRSPGRTDRRRARDRARTRSSTGRGPSCRPRAP